MKYSPKNKPVLYAIILVFSFSVWLSGNLGSFDRHRINDDLIFYHSYFPAVFVKKDLKLAFLKDSTDYYFNRGLYWTSFQKNGMPIIKATYGQSLMHLPFTLCAYLITPSTITGYETPYSVAIAISTLIYYLLSLLLLSKILSQLNYKSTAIALTILTIGFGTNIINYTTNHLGLPHVTDFFLLTCIIYISLHWFKRPTLKHSIYLGLFFGLLILIRPTNIVFIILFLFYNVFTYEQFKLRFRFLIKNAPYLAITSTATLLIICPQLYYWKYVTNSWIYYSYGDGEKFFFSNPHIIEFLIGFRKGWIIYTPLIILSFIGLLLTKKHTNPFGYTTIVITLLLVYINSSWWCWWYGGSYGSRAMIETYPLLAIGVCSFFQVVLNYSSTIKKTAITCLVICMLHNIKSAYLFRVNKIHYDSMTYEAYKFCFFRIMVSDEAYEHLKTLYKAPDYEKARKGIST